MNTRKHLYIICFAFNATIISSCLSKKEIKSEDESYILVQPYLYFYDKKDFYDTLTLSINNFCINLQIDTVPKGAIRKAKTKETFIYNNLTYFKKQLIEKKQVKDVKDIKILSFIFRHPQQEIHGTLNHSSCATEENIKMISASEFHWDYRKAFLCLYSIQIIISDNINICLDTKQLKILNVTDSLKAFRYYPDIQGPCE
jgi:hypothetical protein